MSQNHVSEQTFATGKTCSSLKPESQNSIHPSSAALTRHVQNQAFPPFFPASGSSSDEELDASACPGGPAAGCLACSARFAWRLSSEELASCTAAAADTAAGGPAGTPCTTCPAWAACAPGAAAGVPPGACGRSRGWVGAGAGGGW